MLRGNLKDARRSFSVRKHQMRAHEVFLIAHRNRAANNSRQRWLEPRLD